MEGRRSCWRSFKETSRISKYSGEVPGPPRAQACSSCGGAGQGLLVRAVEETRRRAFLIWQEHPWMSAAKQGGMLLVCSVQDVQVLTHCSPSFNYLSPNPRASWPSHCQTLSDSVRPLSCKLAGKEIPWKRRALHSPDKEKEREREGGRV